MNKFISIFLLFFLLGFTGCDDSEPTPDPSPSRNGKAKQVTLVYAVNMNNGLQEALVMNERQMIESLKTMPEGDQIMMLFKTVSLADENNSKRIVTGLYKAVSGKNAAFTLQKEYSREILPTDPKRIKEVVDEVLKESGELYNIFFWGHGMAWTPLFSDHVGTRSVAPELGQVNEQDGPSITAFGGDNRTDWTDIDELRDALPDNVFETVWFDCCYMSNIETVYELRNKCKWMVAYPTEIWAYGLPYHKVLPYVLGDTQDLAGGVQELFNYYNRTSDPVTGTLMDMSKIENVANACKAIFNSGEKRPSSYGLLNYSRSSGNPYYDFGQYVREYAQANDSENLIDDFNNAFNEFVVYTVTNYKDFNFRPFPKENYSGISTHFFLDGTGQKEDYYRTLSWYKNTYNQAE